MKIGKIYFDRWHGLQWYGKSSIFDITWRVMTQKWRIEFGRCYRLDNSGSYMRFFTIYLW